jgi:hypothetical protein
MALLLEDRTLPSLTVTATNPPSPNGVFTLPAPLTYDVSFNEAVDPTSVEASDLTLSGLAGAIATDVTVLPGNTTARFTIGGVTAEGTLCASIAAGAIKNPFGNPVSAFAGLYQVDVGTLPYPTPLVAKNPPGSLIYDPAATGVINFGGDTDNFTLNLDPGQTVTIIVTASASLQPTVQFTAPGGAVLGSSAASGTGQTALLQTTAATAGGVYTITIGGVGGTTGTYTAQAILNAAQEVEDVIPGVNDDTRAAAQNIDGSFITVQTPQAAAQRGAVLGGNAAAPGTWNDYYAFTAAAGETDTFAINNLTGSGANVFLEDGTGAVLASGVAGATNVDGVIGNFPITTAGTYYVRVSGSAAATYSLVVTKNAAFDAEPNDSFAAAQPLGNVSGVLGAIAAGTGAYQAAAVPFAFEDISGTGTVITALDGQLGDDNSISIPIGFTFPFFDANNSSAFVCSNGFLTFGAPDSSFDNQDLTVFPSIATIAPFWDDLIVTGAANSHVYFQTLGTGANERLVVQWNNVSFVDDTLHVGGLTFEAVLGADGSVRFNYLSLVTGQNVGHDNGASATVGIKAAGTQGPDRLLLAFNNGPNAFVGTGKSTLVNRSAAGGEDWYSINVTTTVSALRLETGTPGDGPGEPGNILNPRIELYDPSDTLVASGTLMGDGRNEFIQYQPLVTGLYRGRITGEAGSGGEYFLSQNFSPTVTAFNVTSPINENDTAVVTGTFSDPGTPDTHTVLISWGPDEGPTQLNLPAGVFSFTANHQYLDDNPTGTPSDVYPIAVLVTDSHAASGSAQISVTVNNVAPSNVVLNTGTINENDTFTLNGSFTDPGTLDTHTVVVTWGPGEGSTTLNLTAGVLTFSASHQYLDDNPSGTPSDVYPVAVTITDDDTGSGTGSTSVTVNNVAPVATLTGPASGSIFAAGTPVTFTGTYSDVGTLDTQTARLTITSDGMTPITTSPVAVSGGLLRIPFTFTSAGVYHVTLTVTDDDTGAGSASTVDGLDAMVVVYDPSAGFVTGGGWINSPAGAYAANPALTGRANFGFVSKYGHGATTPTGQTEFQFELGNLNFHSTSYDWLVVAGARAQFKGNGAINGAGDYTFLITAIDGALPGGGGVDKFRIKISGSGGVVYDNQMGAADDSAAATALGGGNIIIHSQGPPQLAAGGQGPGGPTAISITSDQVSAMLPEAIARWVATGLPASEVALLRSATAEVADLPDGYLGAAPLWGHVITLDVNAAGYGWFVDPTPGHDAEFVTASGVASAPRGGPAAGHMDLLTVVMHELGHVIGLDSRFGGDPTNLMYAYLGTGDRRLPQPAASTDTAGLTGPGEARMPTPNGGTPKLAEWNPQRRSPDSGTDPAFGPRRAEADAIQGPTTRSPTYVEWLAATDDDEPQFGQWRVRI